MNNQPGLEALLQSYQSINVQLSSLNAALQTQNGLLAQTAALAAPTFFSNLTMGLYAMQVSSRCALCVVYDPLNSARELRTYIDTCGDTR